MPLATAGESIVLDALLAGRFMSLHIGDPTVGSVDEIEGGSYARQSATFAKTGDNPTVATNTNLIQFPTATSDWGTITHFGIWTAVSAGTLLAYNTVETPKVMAIDDIARWEVGTLTVTTD